MSQIILSIETATEFCSLALLRGDEILTRSIDTPQKHSLWVLPLIDELLSEAGISLNELNAIAVGQGPGSFTGVRLAISVAQGLCFGADIPCVPISTLASLAYGAREHAERLGVKTIMAAMDARMQEIYGGVFQLEGDELISLIEEFVLKPHEVPRSLFENRDNHMIAIGTGWNEVYKTALLESTGLSPALILPTATPQAADLARLAVIALKAGKIVKPENLIPAYCRNKVTF